MRLTPGMGLRLLATSTALSLLATRALAWEAMPVADLEGLTLRYADGFQEFRAGGATLYGAGNPSLGYWHDEAGSYCSQWPPNDRWTCYGLEREGDHVRFIAADGSFTEGVIE